MINVTRIALVVNLRKGKSVIQCRKQNIIHFTSLNEYSQVQLNQKCNKIRQNGKHSYQHHRTINANNRQIKLNCR